MKKIFLCILAAALLGGGFYAWTQYRDRYMPALEGAAELYLMPDTPADTVLARLASQVEIRWPGSFARLIERTAQESGFKPGHYVLGADFSAVRIARTLSCGWQTPVKLVISGSLRSKGEISRKIGAQLMLDSADVADALADTALLAGYGFNPRTVYAMIVPDTYEVYWTITVRELMDRQKAEYDRFWTEENLTKAKSVGLAPLEVSILASIVKGESKYGPELPRIAGVYLNRLHRGIKLQADPTVAYCHDYRLNRIYRRHLTIDSPYNTYIYQGLPPGPINVPSREYLEAVLNPDYGGGNIFFCADPSFNGSHRFARTLSEHNANARAFHRALTRREAEKRAAAGN